MLCTWCDPVSYTHLNWRLSPNTSKCEAFSPTSFAKSAKNFLSIIFLSFISVYPLNFNKPGWIKSVHLMFILKNISHLVADYTGPANHSVDVGMRMPVDPGIDPAVCYQFSVFTGKGADVYKRQKRTSWSITGNSSASMTRNGDLSISTSTTSFMANAHSKK